jgi:cofilin
MPGGGMSGVSVAEEVLTTYQEIKAGRKHSFVFYEIGKDRKEIVLKETADKSQTWDDMLAKLSPDKPVYVVFDLTYEGKSGINADKPILITW